MLLYASRYNKYVIYFFLELKGRKVLLFSWKELKRKRNHEYFWQNLIYLSVVPLEMEIIYFFYVSLSIDTAFEPKG